MVTVSNRRPLLWLFGALRPLPARVAAFVVNGLLLIILIGVIGGLSPE
jgi:hypothetical protein